MTQDNIRERRQYIAKLLATTIPDIRGLARQWQCSPSAIMNDIRCIEASRDGCTIYGLRDPETGQIHYVGQCNGDPHNRYRKHIHLSQSGRERNIEKARWIGELLAKGKEPSLVILEQCKADQLNEREQWWIKHYLAQGFDLVNIVGKRGGRPRKPAV